MAQYRAAAPLYINSRLIKEGERFESDDIPGSKWLPLDAAAQEAASKREGAPAAKPGMLPAPPVNPGRQLAEIPENWASLDQRERIMLARKLGAPAKGTNADKADQFIKDELARRATV